MIRKALQRLSVVKVGINNQFILMYGCIQDEHKIEYSDSRTEVRAQKSISETAASHTVCIALCPALQIVLRKMQRFFFHLYTTNNHVIASSIPANRFLYPVFQSRRSTQLL